MQVLNLRRSLYLFFLLFLGLNVNVNADFLKGLVNMSCDNYVGFEFIKQNKNVWVCAPGNHIIPLVDGISKSEYSGIQYVVSDFRVIDFPPALFKNKNGELFVNGVSLGNSLNAVVAKDGKVLVGMFIRNFH
jgi:hypothetical protein